MSILDSIKNIGEELLNTDNKNVENKPDITAAGKRTYTVNPVTRSAPLQKHSTAMPLII